MTSLAHGVTVVIPTIPPRWSMVQRAITSVRHQTYPVRAIVVENDERKLGAALNRDAGLAKVTTEWTAFLDDDDEFYSNHIARLMTCAQETDADLVYPWFDVGSGGTDPFPIFFGEPWDNDNRHQVPITFLVKTEAARAVGGFSGGWVDEGAVDSLGNRAGEDWNFINKFCDAGYKIVHLPERTWLWHHWGGNTSGLPTRW